MKKHGKAVRETERLFCYFQLWQDFFRLFITSVNLNFVRIKIVIMQKNYRIILMMLLGISSLIIAQIPTPLIDATTTA